MNVIIPSDSPSVFDQLTTASGIAIVRPNNPPAGIAGFLFDFNGDEELRFRSQITKHYTEANTPVQDQIALEPEEIILKGTVAELSTGLPVFAPVSKAPLALPLNPVMVPGMSPGAIQSSIAKAIPPTLASKLAGITKTAASNFISAQASKVQVGITNKVTALSNSAFSGVAAPLNGALASATGTILGTGLSFAGGAVLNTMRALGLPVPAVKSISTALAPISTRTGVPSATLAAAVAQATTFTSNTDQSISLYQYYETSNGLNNPTNQLDAAMYLYQLWLGRALFSVETAFGIMNNMAILDGRCLQEAETREKSLFTIHFQKVRIAGDATVQLGQLSGRRVFQANPATPNGIASQQPITPAQSTPFFQPFTQ